MGSGDLHDSGVGKVKGHSTAPAGVRKLCYHGAPRVHLGDDKQTGVWGDEQALGVWLRPTDGDKKKRGGGGGGGGEREKSDRFTEFYLKNSLI